MDQTQSSTETSPQLAETVAKINTLQQMLLAADPKMPEHLRAIHATLLKYEEVSHLLSEEQIAVLMSAAQKKLGMDLAAETTKSKKGNGSKLKNISADDL